MSEQLTNNVTTTLASNYTAASGTMSISSSTGVPTSGTFTVAVLNNSNQVVLLFRVSSVSGTTLSGAAEGTDSNQSSGLTVLIGVLSADALAQIKTDSVTIGAGFYQNQNPQPVSGYTWANQGSASATNIGSRAVQMVIPDDSSNSDWHILYQAVPGSTPYTCVMGFRLGGDFRTQYTDFGLWIGDSSGKYIGIIYAINVATFYVLEIASTSSSASVAATYGPNASQGLPALTLVYLKVTDDGTNLTWYFSTDEVNWVQIYQASRTGYIGTPARMGFGGNNQSSSNASGFTIFQFGTNALVAN